MEHFIEMLQAFGGGLLGAAVTFFFHDLMMKSFHKKCGYNPLIKSRYRDRVVRRFMWELTKNEVEMRCLRDDVCRLYNAAVKHDPEIPLKGPSWDRDWIPWVQQNGAPEVDPMSWWNPNTGRE